MNLRISTEAHVQSLAKKLMQFVEADKPMSVEVKPYKKRRSVDQNSRMWALITQISQQMPPHMDGVWHSPEAWHEYFKRRFLGVEPGPFGKPIPKSTAKLITVEFCSYCDEIEAWAAGEGIVLGLDG